MYTVCGTTATVRQHIRTLSSGEICSFTRISCRSYISHARTWRPFTIIVEPPMALESISKSNDNPASTCDGRRKMRVSPPEMSVNRASPLRSRCSPKSALGTTDAVFAAVLRAVATATALQGVCGPWTVDRDPVGVILQIENNIHDSTHRQGEPSVKGTTLRSPR